ncbi:hypothetical protein LCGC14_1327350 [marine sediment metagenome]|uniref:Uncharacterized protein n=1 Tax=marine sediment metagenome TaxID=412755 RepID=A0A0F9KHR2_9ZZZZ
MQTRRGFFATLTAAVGAVVTGKVFGGEKNEADLDIEAGRTESFESLDAMVRKLAAAKNVPYTYSAGPNYRHLTIAWDLKNGTVVEKTKESGWCSAPHYS